MDIRKVKKLIELLEESGIAEIEIKEGEESVRISRIAAAAATVAPTVHAAAPAPHAAAAAMPMQSPTDAAAGGRAKAAADLPDGDVVRAPMVGTFYASPAPGAKPLRRDRQRGQGRRHALHHRGDEDDEPDRSRQVPARSPRSWPRTASRSSSASRCS